jgi:23S rRNA-/tRNA-specific pseudouridylate synthase
MKLLHRGIAEQKPWAKQRGLTYLANAHRLDFETTGVLLLAKEKSTLIKLANLFATENALKTYVALVRGTPEEDQFEVDASIAPHPTTAGLMRIDPKQGKRSKTQFTVREKFRGHTLLECRPLTVRTHQIRVHLRHVKLSIVADPFIAVDSCSSRTSNRITASRGTKPNARSSPRSHSMPSSFRFLIQSPASRSRSPPRGRRT